MSTCGAKTRSGGACKRTAGHGTQHKGTGRCDIHGGKTPIKHGRHSSVLSRRVRDAIEDARGNPDPLNVLPELAKARGILEVWVEDFDRHLELLDRVREGTAPEGLTADDVSGPHPQTLIQALDLISKISNRVAQQHSANHITRANFLRVMREVGRVVQAHVHNEEALERIREDWLELRLR